LGWPWCVGWLCSPPQHLDPGLDVQLPPLLGDRRERMWFMRASQAPQPADRGGNAVVGVCAARGALWALLDPSTIPIGSSLGNGVLRAVFTCDVARTNIHPPRSPLLASWSPLLSLLSLSRLEGIGPSQESPVPWHHVVVLLKDHSVDRRVWCQQDRQQQRNESHGYSRSSYR
jgi:hypothetical protein